MSFHLMISSIRHVIPNFVSLLDPIIWRIEFYDLSKFIRHETCFASCHRFVISSACHFICHFILMSAPKIWRWSIGQSIQINFCHSLCHSFCHSFCHFSCHFFPMSAPKIIWGWWVGWVVRDGWIEICASSAMDRGRGQTSRRRSQTAQSTLNFTLRYDKDPQWVETVLNTTLLSHHNGLKLYEIDAFIIWIKTSFAWAWRQIREGTSKQMNEEEHVGLLV